MRHLAVGLAAIVTLAPATLPPADESLIDSAAALTALEQVIEANPVTGYPAVVIDDCPFGDIAAVAAAVNEVTPINPLVLTEPDTHAWVNPESEQPGFGCWAAYDSLDEPGIFWVEVYATAWRGGEFEGITWGDSWIREDESTEPYLNGELYGGCVVEEDPADTDRVCFAIWYDASVGVQFELNLQTNDGSATVEGTVIAMKAILPSLAAGLVDQPVTAP